MDDFLETGKYKITKTEQKNIMLIGRTRVGKSTIKSLLVDPTMVPDDLTLKSGTKDPVFESFHAGADHMVLNIIDTPGLFERNSDAIDIRDNDTILKTIGICINREITKIHVVCFCVAITEGINQQDMDSLKLLVSYLGEQISNNSCLIITRCELKNEQQRLTLSTELKEDSYFKELISFFKLGIFFSGTLNPDDWKHANDSLVDQYITICDYRTKLIDMFVSDIDAFSIDGLVNSEAKRIREKAEHTATELKELKNQLETQSSLVKQLETRCHDDTQKSAKIISELLELTREYEAKENEKPEDEDPRSLGCPVS